MNAPNEERKPKDNMELLKEQASACGPECGCHATSGAGATRWIVVGVVLLAVAVLVGRALMKTDVTANQPQLAAPAFATAQLTEETPSTASVPKDAPAANKPTSTEALPTTAPATVPAAKTQVALAEKKIVGRSVAGLDDLNAVAANMDAVFVFVPSKAVATDSPPSDPMESASRKLKEQGYQVGLFTLQTDSRDYDRVVARVSVPGILVMVKGRGMGAVSNEITEAKLMQGFVTALSAGGCGPSSGGCGPGGGGCGPSGCR